MDLPSGDQSNPDLPPGVDVSGVGHPPPDETSTICPCQESANHFPSGDRAGACNASTLARSSSVSLACSTAKVLTEYAAMSASSNMIMVALLFICPPRTIVCSSAFRRLGSPPARIDYIEVLPPEGGTTNAFSFFQGVAATTRTAPKKTTL